MAGAEFLTDLARYVEIQGLVEALEAERKAIAVRLCDGLTALGDSTFPATVAGRAVVVRRWRKERVLYDDALLQHRLGDRYVETLDVDMKKVRSRAEDLRSWLGPNLIAVGTPGRERVKALVEAGRARIDEFAGAFVRDVTYGVAVSRSRSQRPGGDQDEQDGQGEVPEGFQ